MEDFEHFNEEENNSNEIKVLGVGGCGTNTVNYIFNEKKTTGVDFIVCNTDKQHLSASPVYESNKILLGKNTKKGLGAGTNPEVGANAAEESRDTIKLMLSGTEMLFITAGMGKGTGTGASPVIADIAKELDILTVAIVTIPFKNEGIGVNKRAKEGLENLKEKVDSLIVVNNQKFYTVYGDEPDITMPEIQAKADDVLANALLIISNIVTHNTRQNVDLKDVRTVLKNSGTCFIGYAEASGDNFAEDVVEGIFQYSRLLENNKIKGADKLIVQMISKRPLPVSKDKYITESIQKATGRVIEDTIYGRGENEEIKADIVLNVIARITKETPQEVQNKNLPSKNNSNAIKVHSLYSEKKKSITYEEYKKKYGKNFKPKKDSEKKIAQLLLPFDEDKGDNN